MTAVSDGSLAGRRVPAVDQAPKLRQRRWISPRECAERLGLHPQSVYELFARGKLPGGRIGRCVRLDWLAIEARLEGKQDAGGRKP